MAERKNKGIVIDNQITYHENYQGKPTDIRTLVEDENHIQYVQYAYPGLILSTEQCGAYQIVEVDKDSFPTKWRKLTSEADEAISKLKSSVSGDLESLKEEISFDYNHALENEINSAKEAFDSYAEKIGQEVTKHLQDKLNQTKDMVEAAKADIERTKEEIASAQTRIDDAATLLNSLQESSGSASVLVDESGATIDLKTFYANISAQTVTEINRHQSSIDAEIIDTIGYVDVSGGTLTDVFRSMNGKMGQIEDSVSYYDPNTGEKTSVKQMLDGVKGEVSTLASKIDTNTGVESQIQQYLSGEDGRALLSGAVVDTVNEKVTGVTQDLNARLGRMETEVWSGGTDGSATSLRDLFELSAKTISRTVSEIISGDSSSSSVTFSDIRQTTNSLSTLVEKIKGGETIAAGMITLINDDDSTQSTIKADKIYLLGETVAEKLNALDLYVNSGATHFSRTGSGYTANGHIKWLPNGSGQIGTSGSVIKWDSNGSISMKVELSDEDKQEIIAANKGVTADQLLNTGIDITGRTIQLTADNFKIQNNIGQTTCTVDSEGNLTANAGYFDNVYIKGKFGNQITYITDENWADYLLDYKVTEPQVVSAPYLENGLEEVLNELFDSKDYIYEIGTSNSWSTINRDNKPEGDWSANESYFYDLQKRLNDDEKCDKIVQANEKQMLETLTGSDGSWGSQNDGKYSLDLLRCGNVIVFKQSATHNGISIKLPFMSKLMINNYFENGDILDYDTYVENFNEPTPLLEYVSAIRTSTKYGTEISHPLSFKEFESLLGQKYTLIFEFGTVLALGAFVSADNIHSFYTPRIKNEEEFEEFTADIEKAGEPKYYSSVNTGNNQSLFAVTSINDAKDETDVCVSNGKKTFIPRYDYNVYYKNTGIIYCPAGSSISLSLISYNGNYIWKVDSNMNDLLGQTYDRGNNVVQAMKTADVPMLWDLPVYLSYVHGIEFNSSKSFTSSTTNGMLLFDNKKTTSDDDLSTYLKAYYGWTDKDLTNAQVYKTYTNGNYLIPIPKDANYLTIDGNNYDMSPNTSDELYIKVNLYDKDCKLLSSADNSKLNRIHEIPLGSTKSPRFMSVNVYLANGVDGAKQALTNVSIEKLFSTFEFKR